MNEAEGAALTERQRYWLEHVQACEAVRPKPEPVIARSATTWQPPSVTDW